MNEKQFEKLKPRGKKVSLSEGRAAYVFPVGFRHLSKFTIQIQKAIRNLMAIEVPKSSTKETMQRILALESLPIIMNDLMGLVEDTTVLGLLDQDDVFHREEEMEFDELPHWDVPKMLEEWFELSFGEERKWNPWISAIEKAILRLTGSKVSLKEMFFKASSSSATTDGTSSKESKQLTMESDSPTEDGP